VRPDGDAVSRSLAVQPDDRDFMCAVLALDHGTPKPFPPNAPQQRDGSRGLPARPSPQR
jgi:hypothetical protein